jgi:hypothetical protein
LHALLPSIRETLYRINIFPTSKRLAIEGEVMKKAKKVQVGQTMSRAIPSAVA